MLRPSFLCLASFAVLSVASAGCSFSPGESTDGDNGNLRFEYTGGSCVLGCGLDRSALQGSMVSLVARERDPDGDVRKTARLVGASIGSISHQQESCSCLSESGSGSSSRGVEPATSCAPGEKKSCTLSINVETVRSGDAKLEITDPAGTVIDRVTMHVRPAARIEVDVRQGASQVDGFYEVKQGFKVKLGSKVYDADGGEVIFTRHGVSHVYGDRTVLKPDSAVLVGSTDVEDMIAIGTGVTSVTVRAEGAEKRLRFRVVP